MIDAGNTRLKWQLKPDADIQAEAWGDDWRSAFVAAAGQQNIKQFLIVAVAEETRQAELDALLAEHWPKARRRWLKPKARSGGVRLAYPDPTQFGVDRWCALMGARTRCPAQAVLVLLAGTAITVDYLQADGQHAGGLILPSLAIMRAGFDCLAPRLSEAWNRPGTLQEQGIFAVDTAGALHLGSRFMLASTVAQLIDGVAAAEGAVPRILLSGGDAAMLADWLPDSREIVPTLICDGARHAARGQR
ncbi:type III pantothenate kinase [Halothiobacillus sp. DCM-1]|uniref:type III pantothenate kinase n=1 Tax=Halothiobacillus sp. DCM-1 TaxID=3112558 RepID=UPI003250A65C